jgi:two-component system NtrC family response regulator
MNPKLLIVEDDDEIRTQMRWALERECEILLAGERTGAMDTFRSARPEVVLLDLGLPPHPNNPEEGLATLSDLLALDPRVKVVIITGQGERGVALRAVGAGAYDFLCKPVEMDELKLLLKRCFHVAQLEKEYRDMQRLQQGEGFEGMLGTSLHMRAVFDSIRKVATADVPVLILGESGTGKEMAALAIHRRSARKDGPFVAINCSAIPETLLESELFGHERGAFTGAHVQRKGRIESANGGTLFLDEI